MNEKEIRFSEHAELKLEVLANHDVTIDPNFVIEVVRYPDKLEQEGDKFIAQKRLTDELVLRVVYREFNGEHVTFANPCIAIIPQPPFDKAQDMLLPTVGEGEKNHSKSLSQNWERDLERGQKGDMLPDGVRWKNSG
jgi:hypothetical protein